jgi:hypothetical protein
MGVKVFIYITFKQMPARQSWVRLWSAKFELEYLSTRPLNFNPHYEEVFGLRVVVKHLMLEKAIKN